MHGLTKPSEEEVMSLRAIIIPLASIFVFVLNSGSFASSKEVKVQSGKELVLNPLYHYDKKTCSYTQIPDVAIKTAPTHGEVSTSAIQTTIRDEGICHDKPVKAVSIKYKPQGGYHGPDRLVAVVTFYKNSGKVLRTEDKEYLFDVR